MHQFRTERSGSSAVEVSNTLSHEKDGIVGSHDLGALITRLSGATPRQLEAVSAGSFLYAALRYVEGFGLIWRQRWAAYVTVIATAAFIPLEVVELARRVSWPKLVVIAMNAAVVWYLIARLRVEWTSRPD